MSVVKYLENELEKCIDIVFLESSDHKSTAVDNTEVMRRHYIQLKKEVEKKKPNVDVVNLYLNKQFPARRAWLQMIPAEQRCKAILNDYPCFSDHVEV